MTRTVTLHASDLDDAEDRAFALMRADGDDLAVTVEVDGKPVFTLTMVRHDD